MRQTHAALLVAGVLGGVGVLVASSPAPAEAGRAAALADQFEVDGVHSSLVFGVGHIGVSTFYGRFNKISGTFGPGGDGTGLGSISVTVQADSVDTANTGRDNHLKGPDFFNAKQFETITFVSESIKAESDGAYKATGTLTLHGVSKEITVDIKNYAERDAGGRMGYRGGFEAAFDIKRSDHDMTFMIDNGGLGDTVHLIVSLEGVRK